MAKHGRRRKYRRYLRGNIDLDMLLGTLGAEALISQELSDTLVEQAWLTSVRISVAMINFTRQSNDGPILVGCAHSDYTSSEIESWVENLSSWDSGDLLAQEIGRRKIRQIGTIPTPESVADSGELWDGATRTIRCGWMLNTAETIRFWAYNQGSSALAATDPTVHFSGHANLWPT